MAKKDKKNKGNKENKATGPIQVETAKDDLYVVTQLAKAAEVEGKGKDGQFVTSSDIGDIMITLKTGDTGQQRKTYKIVGDKTNTRVTKLREMLRDAKANPPAADSEEDSKAGKKGKKGKKDKKGKKEDKAPELDPAEFLKDEELEAKHKVKKAKAAISGVDYISKKQVKKIVSQWGDAKKITGSTIVRTVTSITAVTGEQMMELMSSI